MLLRYDTDRDRDSDGDVQGYAEKKRRRKRKARGRRGGDDDIWVVDRRGQQAVNDTVWRYRVVVCSLVYCRIG